jgi:dihydrofolate reductase
MTDYPFVTAVAAMADNNCIGQGGALPWHIREDLKFFKRVTRGKPVIMGRKTFDSILESLGKPLPNRENIIVSRSTTSPHLNPPPSLRGEDWRGLHYASCIEEAIELAKHKAAEQDINDIIIGGGAQIYELALPFTDIIYLTRVHRTVDGDTFFPELDEATWVEDWREEHPDNDPPFSFTRLVRSQSPPAGR